MILKYCVGDIRKMPIYLVNLPVVAEDVYF